MNNEYGISVFVTISRLNKEHDEKRIGINNCEKISKNKFRIFIY